MNRVSRWDSILDNQSIYLSMGVLGVGVRTTNDSCDTILFIFSARPRPRPRPRPLTYKIRTPPKKNFFVASDPEETLDQTRVVL